MSAVAKQRMNVDQFLAWTEEHEGRFELDDGEVVAMSPQKVRHARTKYLVHKALERAIERASLPCEMLPDGITVRIDDFTACEPDATVSCGPEFDLESKEAARPELVVEVSSPGTRSLDAGRKLIGYFRVPSIIHYVIIDTKSRVIVHHQRGAGDRIDTRILASGKLILHPPGLEIEVGELFLAR